MAKLRKSIEANIPLARLLNQDLHADSLELLAQEKVDPSLEDPQIEILVEELPIIELSTELSAPAVAIYPIVDIGEYSTDKKYNTKK